MRWLSPRLGADDYNPNLGGKVIFFFLGACEWEKENSLWLEMGSNKATKYKKHSVVGQGVLAWWCDHAWPVLFWPPYSLLALCGYFYSSSASSINRGSLWTNSPAVPHTCWSDETALLPKALHQGPQTPAAAAAAGPVLKVLILNAPQSSWSHVWGKKTSLSPELWPQRAY